MHLIDLYNLTITDRICTDSKKRRRSYGNRSILLIRILRVFDRNNIGIYYRTGSLEYESKEEKTDFTI